MAIPENLKKLIDRLETDHEESDLRQQLTNPRSASAEDWFQYFYGTFLAQHRAEIDEMDVDSEANLEMMARTVFDDYSSLAKHDRDRLKIHEVDIDSASHKQIQQNIGWSLEKFNGLMGGIDLKQPVKMQYFPAGTIFYSFSTDPRADRSSQPLDFSRVGNFFTPKIGFDSRVQRLGVTHFTNGTMRVISTWKLKKDLELPTSTAGDIDVTWTTPRQFVRGGGTQVYISDHDKDQSLEMVPSQKTPLRRTLSDPTTGFKPVQKKSAFSTPSPNPSLGHDSRASAADTPAQRLPSLPSFTDSPLLGNSLFSSPSSRKRREAESPNEEVMEIKRAKNSRLSSSDDEASAHPSTIRRSFSLNSERTHFARQYYPESSDSESEDEALSTRPCHTP